MAPQIKMPTTDDLMSMWNASGLKQKIIFTFLMIAAFRFGVQMPLFGINNQVFANIAQGNNIIGFLDLFSGGALGKVSIFALGIGPYITSSIIIQLVSVVIPSLEKLQKEEGEAGRRKLSQYTRVFTVVLAVFQSLIFMLYLHHLPGAVLPNVNPIMFFISSIVVLTAGSVLVMWISELMTEKGIGNGGSLIIFIGILSGIPIYASRTAQVVANNSMMQLGLAVLLLIFFAAMVFIVIMQEAVRKVIIVNQDVCIGCMTCTRVCPAAGAINVFKTNKLPYINPGYCARCEECMHSCPSTAIKYSSRKKAFKLYSEIKSYDMVSEIVDKDMKRLSIDLIGLNGSLKKISKTLSLEFDDADYEGYIQYNVNDMMNRELNLSLGENIEIKKFGKLFESYLINRGIEVFDKKCIACGECLNSCPTGAISLDAPKPIVIDENKCVYCGRCVGDCQFGAIRAYDDYFHSKGCDLFFSRSDLKGQREADFSLASEKCQSCGICVKN